MNFYFQGSYNPEPRKEGKLAKVSIYPSSNSRTAREIFVLVAKEIENVESGKSYSFGLVGEKKTPMIFPDNQKTDKRILVMGEVPQPKHRACGYLDTEKTTANIIDESCGGGAWGAGSCFLAIIEVGQRAVSNKLIVWENVDGELVKKRFESLAEYELAYNTPQIEFI